MVKIKTGRNSHHLIHTQGYVCYIHICTKKLIFKGKINALNLLCLCKQFNVLQYKQFVFETKDSIF